MKRLVIMFGSVFMVIVVTAVSMANMNVVNLLVSDTTYGSDGSSEMFTNKEQEVDRQYLKGTTLEGEGSMDGVQESIQSGLGSGGGELNLLNLLQNAKDIDKKSYAYNLLDVYAKLSGGVYNDYKHHVASSALAGVHYNETKLATYINPSPKGYGKGDQTNGKSLDKAYEKDKVGGGGPVYVALGTDKSCPDGPLQILSCNPGTPIDKRDGKRKYDPYHFPDNLNFVDASYAKIIKANGNKEFSSKLAPTAYTSLEHNRGEAGVIRLMYGQAYNTQGGLSGSTVGQVPKKDLPKILKIFTMVQNKMKKANVPLEDMTGDATGYSLGMVTLGMLACGGFIEEPLKRNTANGIANIPNSVVKKLFPGQTSKTIAGHINSKYVKKPWDVAGMSKSEYAKIYKMTADKYTGMADPGGDRNYVLLFHKGVKVDNYSSGKNRTLMTAFDGVSAAHWYESTMNGEYILLQIALAAGIKSLTQDELVDPTNPQKLDKSNADNGQYSPSIDGTGNFKKLMKKIGVSKSLSKGTQLQFNAMYEVSGGTYSLTTRGTKSSDGKLITDCSVFTTIGFEQGKRKGSAYPNTRNIVSHMLGGVKTKKGMKATAKQVKTDGTLASKYKSGAYTKTDEKWNDILKPGDIVNASANHVYTVIRKNRTGKTVTVSPELSKTTAKGSTIPPGTTMTFESSIYQRDRGDKMGFGHHGYDTSGSPYEAFRPSYSAHYK